MQTPTDRGTKMLSWLMEHSGFHTDPGLPGATALILEVDLAGLPSASLLKQSGSGTETLISWM